jgi:hypothetical protein
MDSATGKCKEAHFPQIEENEPEGSDTIRQMPTRRGGVSRREPKQLVAIGGHKNMGQLSLQNRRIAKSQSRKITATSSLQLHTRISNVLGTALSQQWQLTRHNDCNQDDDNDGSDDAHAHLHVLPPHGLPDPVGSAAEALGGDSEVVRLVLQRVEALSTLRDLVDVVTHDAHGAVDFLHMRMSVLCFIVFHRDWGPLRLESHRLSAATVTKPAESAIESIRSAWKDASGVGYTGILEARQTQRIQSTERGQQPFAPCALK